MNFYDPSQYASESNSLSPLASDETVFELKTVLVYDNATMQVVSQKIPLELVEYTLQNGEGWDIDPDGVHVYFRLGNELSGKLADDYGPSLVHAVAQVFGVERFEHIGRFNACQVHVKTICMDIHVDDSCKPFYVYATGVRVLDGEGIITLLYTD